MEDQFKAVEIGPRSSSVIELVKDFDWHKDKAILLEKDPSWLETMAQLYKKNPNLKPLIADGSKMPLPNDTAELIFSKDLFCSHGVETILPDGQFSGKPSVIEIDKIAQESYRVCEAGGQVIILETAIPYGKNSQALSEEIINTYIRAGFRLQDHHIGADINNIFKKGIDGSTGEDNFALVFIKPSPPEENPDPPVFPARR